MSKQSDPGMYVLKYAHCMTCIRTTNFSGPIQPILDNSGFFQFGEQDILNLRVDCVELLNNLQLKFLSSRNQPTTDTTE